MSQAPSDNELAARERRHRTHLRKPLLVMVAVVGAGALYLALSVGLGAVGVGCSGCHNDRWYDAESPHAQLACTDCHANGPAGRIEIGLHLAGALLPFTEATTPQRPERARCLACHAQVLSAPLAANGLAIDHARCMPEGGVCSDCHGAVLHPGPSASVRTAQMDVCLACHVDITRPEGCDLCHVGDDREADANTPWKVTHGAQWQTTHGAGDLSTCRYCHTDPDDCTECHIDMPHPDGWAAIHGTGVRADRGACTTCHQSAFCDSCHGMLMPHPDDWLPTHSANTNGYDDPLCMRCHLEQDCVSCHVAHTHPGRATPDD